MFKNVATKIALFAFDSTTNLPKTGDAANITAYVSKDYGTVTALADTSATELDATNAKGWYLFDVAQAEVNADFLLFTAKSTTANISLVARPIYTRPANFSSLVISAGGAVGINSNLKKNQALANFSFLMTDSTTHNPATGKTVTVTRKIDNGSHAALASPTVTEVANGEYRVDLGAADLNGNTVTLRATASGCDDLVMALILTP